MTKEEAIQILADLIDSPFLHTWEKQNKALHMAIEALSADAVQGVGRYENAMQKLRDMPRYLNGVKEKQITKVSANYTTEKPNDEVEQGNDAVVEPTDLISRADALEQIAQAECGLHYEDCEADNCACDYIWRILNIPSADRPTELLLKDGTLKVKTDNGADVNRVLVWGDDGCGGLYYADDRPSGEWAIVNKGLDIYICDQCGEVEQIQRIPIWDYCPNCGAKMGGK